MKTGTRLRSQVCSTEVVVVRAPADDVEISCGGQAMVPLEEGGEPTGAPLPDRAEGTLLGKRYADEELGIELLCTKAGEGSLAVNGALLAVKGAKPLPSSD